MCGVIVAGFFLGVEQEQDQADLSFGGIMCGILASACVALNSIFISKVLPVVEGDMWRLTAYNNANAIVLFLPVMWVMDEFDKVMVSDDIFSGSYWTLMTIAGFFGITPTCCEIFFTFVLLLLSL